MKEVRTGVGNRRILCCAIVQRGALERRLAMWEQLIWYLSNRLDRVSTLVPHPIFWSAGLRLLKKSWVSAIPSSSSRKMITNQICLSYTAASHRIRSHKSSKRTLVFHYFSKSSLHSTFSLVNGCYPSTRKMEASLQPILRLQRRCLKQHWTQYAFLPIRRLWTVHLSNRTIFSKRLLLHVNWAGASWLLPFSYHLWIAVLVVQKIKCILVMSCLGKHFGPRSVSSLIFLYHQTEKQIHQGIINHGWEAVFFITFFILSKFIEHALYFSRLPLSFL